MTGNKRITAKNLTLMTIMYLGFLRSFDPLLFTVFTQF